MFLEFIYLHLLVASPKFSNVWVENTKVISPFYIPRLNIPSLMFCLVGAD